MQPSHRITHVTWSGQASVQQAIELLQRHGRVELELPPDLHHTLFVHLNPDARPARLEELDVDGGVDLLERLAGIRQLGALSALAEAARKLGAEVNVSSPAPLVSVCTPGWQESH